MNCMKCGREVSLGQVFCKDCLADMEQYPIAPETPVPMFDVTPSNAPKRPTPARKQKKPEDQIPVLKRWIASLCVILFVVLLGFSMITAILLHRLDDVNEEDPWGQNYISQDTT